MSHPTAAGPTATETDVVRDPPLVGRADWRDAHPWLVQGTTVRTEGGGDFRLHGPAPGAEILPRWDALRRTLGMTAVVHARQVHGTAIRVARSGPAGLVLTPPCDGHLTRDPGVLLTVAVADCVPIFIMEPESRTLGLLHGGWRGVAEGILERGIESMWTRFGLDASSLELHLGPAISGSRYEVGPEVFEALGRPVPASASLLDLRSVLVERALAAGCVAERVGVSAICVHDDPRFYSHRAGDEGRQLAVLGYRGRPGSRR